MKEYRAKRSPPSTLSSRKRGLNALSLAKAETGVSRSPAMSNGGFRKYSSENEKTHPGVCRRWVLVLEIAA
jgi:hypothetical protein